MNALKTAIFFFFLLPAVAVGTVQRKEGILIANEKGMIAESPLADFLQQREMIFLEYSTANRAGYSAEWEVRNGHLMLTAFVGKTSVGDRGLDLLFPDAKGPIMATWYSGTLYAEIGKQKDSILMGHFSIKESLVVIHVEAGRVVKSQRYDYPKNIEILRKNARLSNKFPLDSELREVIMRGDPEEINAIQKRIIPEKEKSD